MRNIQTKFDANTMFLLSIDPARDGYSPENAEALFEKLREPLKAVGAMRSIALAAQAPFSIARATAQLAAAKNSRDPSQKLKLARPASIGSLNVAT